MAEEKGAIKEIRRKGPHLCNTGPLLELRVEMLVPILSTESKPPRYEEQRRKKREREECESAVLSRWGGCQRRCLTCDALSSYLRTTLTEERQRCASASGEQSGHETGVPATFWPDMRSMALYTLEKAPLEQESNQRDMRVIESNITIRTLPSFR